MKKIVSAVIISSFLFGAGVVSAAEKETSAQAQLRQEYLATLEHARLEYLAAEKKARAELKAASKAAKGKKAGARKKVAQKAYDAAMKKIRKEFVAAKNAAKKEYASAKASAKTIPKGEVSKEEVTSPSAPAGEQPKEQTPQAAAPQSPPAGGSSTPAAPAPTVITYSSAGFSPTDLTVKTGTVVTFKNEAEDRLWVASDPHPSHTVYPEFDDKKGIEKGGEYIFTFTKTGEWRYHNHLNPGKRGSVKVE